MNATIKFMDLKRQYDLHKNGISKAISSVCEETAFSGGKYVEQLEKAFSQYCGVMHCACVANGTEAIHLAMRVLGVAKDDEVIVPANTFIASAWGASYAGAKPVFVDCTADTWEIDPTQLEEAITERTKVIVGVHLYGQPFDFDSINEIAGRHKVAVLEDCAQAHGAKYNGKIVGGLGAMSCFSFYPGKNLGAFGEGGAVLSNNKHYIERIERLRNHGSRSKYQHDEIGYNSRMDGIQGAILNYKLGFLQEWINRRRFIAKRYLDEIANPLVQMQVHPENTECSYHLFVVTTPNREIFTHHLNERGIECAQHYPIPCHLQKAYSHLGYTKGDLPNAEWLADHCSSIPMFPELGDDEVSRVIEACNSFKC